MNTKGIIKSIFRKFGLGISKYSTLERLDKESRAFRDLELIKSFPREYAALLIEHLPYSTAQLRQDLFVLGQLGFKKNGFFVEFGATNGIDLSNTFLLETKFGWSGILAEPAKCWHADLRKNRDSSIETRCVWKDSCSILSFREARLKELSTIDQFRGSDSLKSSRNSASVYEVPTISLNDLLEEYNAPYHMEYLSIDTEGSEYEILSKLNFEKYSFDVITCEHNFTNMREKLFSLLSRNGYKRVFEELSGQDDWYVKD